MSDNKANLARLPTRVEPTADIDFPSMIATVLERGLDPQVIQSVLQMYNDHQDRRHMEALNSAVANVCAEVLPVMRDATNTHLRNKYATHIAMMSMLQPLLLKHGVRVGFDVGALPGEEPVQPGCVRIRIVVGYGAATDRSSYIDEPITQAGSQGGRTQMTQNQALTSATTYAQRTLLRLKFNISSYEEDDDGEGTRQRPADTRPSTRDTPAAGAAPAQNGVDHEAYKQAFRRRLYLAIDEAAIEALLAIPDIKNWLTAAPLRITADIEAMLTAKRKLLVEQAAMKEQEAAKAAPSELLRSLLADIAACADKAALDKTTDSAVFTADVAKLSFMEGDQVTEAVKDRYAELGA